VGTFVLGLVYFHEHLPASQLTGYVLVWIALVVFTIDSVVASRTSAEALSISR
jgi:EamA domain-containing membrane protein RarD